MAKPLSSVAKPNVTHLSRGWLLPTDQLWLAPGLRLQKETLLDTATGARHELHPLGIRALALLTAGIEAGAWCRLLQGAGATTGQITGLIAQLAAMGGLRVRRRWRDQLPGLFDRGRWLLLGGHPLKPARRWPLGPAGVVTACTRALAPVLGALAMTTILWSLTGLATTGTTQLALTAATTLWSSVVLHELAHSVAIARHAPVPAVILQRGLRLGLLHRPLSPRAEASSALIGPCTGALAALLMSPHLLGGLIALLHLASLSPLAGDGRSLMRAVAGARG